MRSFACRRFASDYLTASVMSSRSGACKSPERSQNNAVYHSNNTNSTVEFGQQPWLAINSFIGQIRRYRCPPDLAARLLHLGLCYITLDPILKDEGGYVDDVENIIAYYTQKK